MSNPVSIRGLTTTGVAGYGTHGPILLGEWNGHEVSVRRVQRGSVPLSTHRRRLRALSEITSTNLAKIIHVEERADGFTVISENVAGPTLTTLRAGTGGLTLTEGWRLLADVCMALATLHKNGIIHADVSPANVLVRSDSPSGRAVLIDVGGEEDWELGTVGFRAPEISSGAPASSSSDVWSAARVALWAVGQEHRLLFAELLAHVLHAEPATRPDAATLATQAEAEAGATIGLPDEARLASAHLRAKASSLPTTRAGRRMRRRKHSYSRPLMVGVFLALLLATYLIADGSAQPEDRGRVEQVSGPSESEAETAVVDLTQRRDHALAEHNQGLLEQITVAGSDAAAADQKLLASFQGSKPAGLHTHVDVQNVHGPPEAPVVRALLQQGGFTWDGGVNDGVEVAALPPRCVRIHLVSEGGNWLVQRVSACAASGISG